MIELAGRSTEDPERLSGTLLLPGGVEIGRIRAMPAGDGDQPPMNAFRPEAAAAP